MADLNYKILEEENKALGTWRHIQTLVESTSLDIYKNAGGNVAAGVRSRRSLRKLGRLVRDLINMTVESDKKTRTTRRQNRKDEKCPVDKQS